MKSFIGDMDIETRCICVRFIIDYYYYSVWTMERGSARSDAVAGCLVKVAELTLSAQ